MNCEETQLNLALYADDVLTDAEKASIEVHLPVCPLCRAALSEFGSMRNEYRQLSFNEMPVSLGRSIKHAISEQLEPSPLITIAGYSNEPIREKIVHWLMPYSIGTVAASVFTIAFLFVLMSDLQSSVTVLQTRNDGETSVMLANSNADDIRADLQLAPEYGGVMIATAPPEFNPAGALFALSKSIVRGNMKDEEVVVVADVFGNGLTRIAEVVDPPENDRAMRELEKAFNTDPSDAPFLPRKSDLNSKRVRVVVKIQRVDVYDR